MSDFKAKNPADKRKAEAQRIREKFPDRIPIIAEHAKGDRSGVSDVDRNKYLVPSDLTLGQFGHVLRKRIKLQPTQSLFLFINGNIPLTSALMSELYKSHRDRDGFLYIQFAGESTFG